MAKFIVDVDAEGKVVAQAPYVEQPSRTVSEESDGIHWGALVRDVGIGLGLLILLLASIIIVKQQTIVIIERLGKFVRIARAGFSFRIPFIDQRAGELDLRVQELNVEVETKTKDNVFVTANVAVQYYINPEKAMDAFYKLEEPKKQISSYVFDTVRSQVPNLNLDDVFQNKEHIAEAVKTNLAQTMDDFGYVILKSLVTDINPDEKVKESMNEINAQQRLRAAAQEKGEAEKVLAVKRAEAEAESKKLQGEGIANQRKAIIDGLKSSVKDFQETIPGTEANDVMNLVLLTQYFDTLKDIGTTNNTHTIMLPHSPNGLQDIKDQLALMVAKK